MEVNMIIDVDTGEVIGNKFSKLFYNDIALLFKLSGTDIKVLLLMSKSIGLGNVNTLKMTPKRKKEFAGKLGLKSHLQITNALHKLCLAGVVKKLDPENRFDFDYMINPEIICAGNDFQRVRVVIDYSDGTRNVKTFSSEEKFREYMLEEADKDEQAKEARSQEQPSVIGG